VPALRTVAIVRSIRIPLVFALVASASPALAGDEERLQDQITQFSMIAADLEKSDGAGVATAEIAKLKSWLTEAQAKLAAGDEDEVEILVRRFKPEVRYIRTILARSDAEAKLASMKEEEERLDDEAKKHKGRAQELDIRRKELQSALNARRGGGLKKVNFGEDTP